MAKALVGKMSETPTSLETALEGLLRRIVREEIQGLKGELNGQDGGVDNGWRMDYMSPIVNDGQGTQADKKTGRTHAKRTCGTGRHLFKFACHAGAWRDRYLGARGAAGALDWSGGRC